MPKPTILSKFNCPVPYHAVRTVFMGAIASPRRISPLEVIKELWDGKLPPVEQPEDLNELLNFLLQDVWNGLTVHQQRSKPFKLTELKTKPTRPQVLELARTRLEELDGFLDGLLGEELDMDLPGRADEALNFLGEIRGFFYRPEQLMLDKSGKPSKKH